jgi:hypothetical protein
MPYVPLSELLQKRLHSVRFRGGLAAGAIAVVGFVFIGLVYNAIAILRLPQSGLKTLEIVWVSLTACLLVILFAMAVAAGLEHVGEWLTPKPPGEEWQREELRHRSIGARHAAEASEGRPSAGATAQPGSSSAA